MTKVDQVQLPQKIEKMQKDDAGKDESAMLVTVKFVTMDILEKLGKECLIFLLTPKRLCHTRYFLNETIPRFLH